MKQGNDDLGANRKSEQEEEERHAQENQQNRTREGMPILEPDQEEVYREALQILKQSGVTHAVGAAFARHAYTSIWRYTKDLDVFIAPRDLKIALQAFREAGFESKVVDRRWLAKARKKGYFIDLIFGNGHGQVAVDEDSFNGSTVGMMLGVQTRFISVEEMIASIAFVAGRNRFDGGDIVHLIRSTEGKLDWDRILNRMGKNRGELLLWHLILFDFVYPSHSDYLPKELMVELFEEVRLRWSDPVTDVKSFRGSILDPYSYAVDIEDWGYEDLRNMEPIVNEEGELL